MAGDEENVADAVGPSPTQVLPASDFSTVIVNPTYSPDDEPLNNLYVPLLARAVSYDRLVGYYSARMLARAARGVAPFVARGGRMRLVAGAQLNNSDVEAVVGGEPLEQVLVNRLRADPLGDGVEVVERQYLQLLAWMVQRGMLEMKVGVPVGPNGLPLPAAKADRYFHSKYGIFTDSVGQQVAFMGSENETPSGWEKNHETLMVAKSWKESQWEDYGEDILRRFAQHWGERPDAGWAIVSLPTAIRDDLLKLLPPGYVPPGVDPDPELRNLTPGTPTVPPELPVDGDVALAKARLIELRDAPLVDGGTGVGLLSAEASPLPHQLRIAYRAVSTFPRSYLLADEVGLGKTIEAGLIIRELFLSGRASSALLLVPASVLKQWQEELHEKLSLDVPRYIGNGFVDRNDEPIDVEPTANPWSAFPIVLASSHLARRSQRRSQLLAAGPWDVVLVDEAHHARRRGSKATETPNALLATLQQMKAEGSWKCLYLASATPMQMAAHEAWDLIELFDLPGWWGRSAHDFEQYFIQLRNDDIRRRDWNLLQHMLGDYMGDAESERDTRLEGSLKARLGFAKAGAVKRLHSTPISKNTVGLWTPEQAEAADEWLRAHTPMKDRVFRTTRQTMRRYKDAGILSADVVIPRRHIDDAFVPLTAEERELYDRIDDYIGQHYNSYRTDQTRQALGFIMTVYRRRLTSSFYAIRCSLQRRLEALQSGRSLMSSLDDDDRYAAEDDTLFDTVNLDMSDQLLADEIDQIRSFIDAIDNRLAVDSKAQRLDEDLRDTLDKYDSVVIFTQYTDTMNYLRDRLALTYGRIACYSGRGGEVWQPATQTWSRVSKAQLKTMFRDGEVRILLGTDSMSEGLNLQTSGRLINYDMPWNFMRVEQRIGRVDRIGAKYELVTVSNYFYADTVEQRVYDGIKGDFGDFVDIVGDAQPVLASTEAAIRAAALTDRAHRDQVVAEQIDLIRDRVADATSGAVRLSDSDDLEVELPPPLHPASSLEALAEELRQNILTRDRFEPVEGHPGVFRLMTDPHTATQPGIDGAGGVLVSFDRSSVEEADVDTRLLTWGTPEFNALLASALAADGV